MFSRVPYGWAVCQGGIRIDYLVADTFKLSEFVEGASDFLTSRCSAVFDTTRGWLAGVISFGSPLLAVRFPGIVIDCPSCADSITAGSVRISLQMPAADVGLTHIHPWNDRPPSESEI